MRVLTLFLCVCSCLQVSGAYWNSVVDLSGTTCTNYYRVECREGYAGAAWITKAATVAVPPAHSYSEGVLTAYGCEWRITLLAGAQPQFVFTNNASMNPTLAIDVCTMNPCPIRNGSLCVVNRDTVRRVYQLRKNGAAVCTDTFGSTSLALMPGRMDCIYFYTCGDDTNGYSLHVMGNDHRLLMSGSCAYYEADQEWELPANIAWGASGSTDPAPFSTPYDAVSYSGTQVGSEVATNAIEFPTGISVTNADTAALVEILKAGLGAQVEASAKLTESFEWHITGLSNATVASLYQVASLNQTGTNLLGGIKSEVKAATAITNGLQLLSAANTNWLSKINADLSEAAARWGAENTAAVRQASANLSDELQIQGGSITGMLYSVAEKSDIILSNGLYEVRDGASNSIEIAGSETVSNSWSAHQSSTGALWSASESVTGAVWNASAESANSITSAIAAAAAQLGQAISNSSVTLDLGGGEPVDWGSMGLITNSDAAVERTASTVSALKTAFAAGSSLNRTFDFDGGETVFEVNLGGGHTITFDAAAEPWGSMANWFRWMYQWLLYATYLGIVVYDCVKGISFISQSKNLTIPNVQVNVLGNGVNVGVLIAVGVTVAILALWAVALGVFATWLTQAYEPVLEDMVSPGGVMATGLALADLWFPLTIVFWIPVLIIIWRVTYGKALLVCVAALRVLPA